jgi:hypothetical protein
MRNSLGSILKVLGYIIFAIFGLWSFIIDLTIVYQAAGFWGFVIAFVLFPITFAVAPWYALIIQGNWFPLVIGYGGGIVAVILFYIGSAIAPDEVYSLGAAIAGDEMQLSPTPKKYVKWYRVVLIIFLILGALAEMMTYSNTPLASITSIIRFLFFIASIIGLAMKEKWGSVLVMVNSVYSILSTLFSIRIITRIITNLSKLSNQGNFIGWILVIVSFSLFIFQFVIALKEYRQLGNIETKGGLSK